MKILFVASEVNPFRKTGGLADVTGTLPKALAQLGHDVRIMMPKYAHIPEQYTKRMCQVKHFRFHVGWRDQYCGIWQMEHEGLTCYFVDNEYYFHRAGLYGYEDDAERFSFFCRGVLVALPHIEFQPHIVHCHDWPTGLVSVFLHAHFRAHSFYQHVRTVFSIHNLRYQGVFPKEIMSDLLHLGDDYFTYEQLEFFGQVNFMKGGLVFADQLTTVSETYAREIQHPYFGENLQDTIRHRQNDLTGILNGLDRQAVSPQFGAHILGDDSVVLSVKMENKLKLQDKLRLPVEREIPLVGIVSRLDVQKGFELIECVLDEILSLGLQVVLLGTGDPHFEHFFQAAAQRHRQHLAVQITFDDTLAQLIYAGSDLFLMPSKYEPCGISQMVAMSHGSVPIVRETGGLQDTVQPYDEQTGTGHGFRFTNYNAHDMLHTIEKAVQCYHNKHIWPQLVQRCLQQNFSWERSARKYVEVYERVLNS